MTCANDRFVLVRRSLAGARDEPVCGLHLVFGGVSEAARFAWCRCLAGPPAADSWLPFGGRVAGLGAAVRSQVPRWSLCVFGIPAGSVPDRGGRLEIHCPADVGPGW